MGSRRPSPRGRGLDIRSPWLIVALLIIFVLGLDFAGWLGGTKSFIFSLILGPRRPPPAMEAIAGLVETELAAEKIKTRPVHRFMDSEGNLHLKIDLAPEQYSRLAPALEKRLEAAGAVLLQEQEESDTRAAYHLWDIRAAEGRRTHILFSCLTAPSKAPPKTAPRRPGRTPTAPGLVAIIMDDLGYNLEVVRDACGLNLPLTVSILPFSPHAVESAQIAHEHGLEVMLHMPMESREHHETERYTEGLLQARLSDDEIREKVREELYQVPYIRGVNNHMGSLLTEDAGKMEVVLSVLREYGLYFVDSRTSASSRALEVARRLDLPAAGCDLFLDASGEPADFRKNLRALLRLAAKRGWAVGIVHPYDTTLEALRVSGALFEEYKVKLVPLSEILARTSGN